MALGTLLYNGQTLVRLLVKTLVSTRAGFVTITI